MATAICCTSNVTLTVGDNTLPKTRQHQETLAIEKGLPIPSRRCRSISGATAEKMQIGDSVLCETERDAQRLRDALRYRGRGYCLAKEQTGDRLGYRVWRKA